MPSPSPRRLRARVTDKASRTLRRAKQQAGPAAARVQAAAPEVARPRRAPAPAPTPAPAAPRGTALVERLLHDGDLTAAVLGQVRAWVADQRPAPAVSLAESLRRRPETRDLGDLASGIVAFQRGFPELAWSRFDGLAARVWAPHAPEEYVRCGLAHAHDRTVAEVRRLLDEDPELVRLGDWITLAGVAFGAAEHDLADDILTVVDKIAEQTPHRPEGIDRRRHWLRPWVQAEVGHTGPRGDRPVFAVMDYGHPQPSRGSANIGDHVQSIASLGHLVRHQGLRYHGDPELVSLLERLAGRTRPELRLDDVDADLDVLTIHRDASMYQEIPEGTWTLCFGWFMHQLFKERYGFPLHDALRPLFLSFHCNKRDLLTDDAIAYLRRYGPVGCRDWTTVYLLLSAGVPAFFSGCLTTTVSTVFPELDERPPRTAPVGYVDVPDGLVEPGAPTYAHSDRAVRTRSFLENCDRAVELLETYRRDLSAVVTSRLHAYLPLRSLGVPVDFRPANLSDIRFDGLAGITDEAFEDIRTGILDILQGVFSLILSGAGEDEVYARWRELTADRVAAAERRLHAEPAALPAAPEQLAARVARAVAHTVTVEGTGGPDGEPVHVAVPVTKGEVGRLAPLVRSLRAHSSRPLHVWVLGRPKADHARAKLAAQLPDVTFSWVRTGGLDRAFPAPLRVPNTAARVLLRELLPGVDRVVVLPPAAVVEGDIAELADLDLGGHAFAAARSRESTTSGYHRLHDAAARLGRDTARSAELRRTAHALHAFDFDAFATNLLVVDLPRLAEQVPSATAVGLMQHYGLRPDEVLLYLAGPDRAEIPERWQHEPTEDAVRDPLLVRWTGARPWDHDYAPEQERWHRHARKSAAADIA
jgi:hypothetical protein